MGKRERRERERERELDFYYVTAGRALHDRSKKEGKTPSLRILIGLACSRQSENFSRLVTSQSRFAKARRKSDWSDFAGNTNLLQLIRIRH